MWHPTSLEGGPHLPKIGGENSDKQEVSRDLEVQWERLGPSRCHTPAYTYKTSTKVSFSNIQSVLIKEKPLLEHV